VVPNDDALDLIATHLAESREALMEQWRKLAREAQPTKTRLSDEEIDDHLPVLLMKLEETIRGDGTLRVEPEGAEHGHQRRQLGYTVPQILLEFRLFRHVVMKAIDDHYEANTSRIARDQIREVRRRLLDVIDRSMTASAARYTTDTEEERNAAFASLKERT